MENQLIPDEIIMNKIYYIRGQKIMLAVKTLKLSARRFEFSPVGATEPLYENRTSFILASARKAP